MHYLLAISSIFIVCYCAPLPQDSGATIIRSVNTNDGKGNYHFSFETSNGIIREETGTLVDVGLPNEHISVKGSYIYTDLEGLPVIVYYKADENGYSIVPLKNTFFTGSISPQILASLLGK